MQKFLRSEIKELKLPHRHYGTLRQKSIDPPSADALPLGEQKRKGCVKITHPANGHSKS
jgi:hypothetical protein